MQYKIFLLVFLSSIGFSAYAQSDEVQFYSMDWGCRTKPIAVLTAPQTPESCLKFASDQGLQNTFVSSYGGGIDGGYLCIINQNGSWLFENACNKAF